MAETVADLGEPQLIQRIRTRVLPAPDWVLEGIGDDAAVVRGVRGELDVLTTDALIEGVHFDWILCTPADVGHKALAVNLSDLAAMGAKPRLALLSLALPASFPVTDFDALIGGFVDLAAEHHVSIVGGNITRSPGPLVVDVTATGSVRRRRILRRGTARAGDGLFVSGQVGSAAAGLEWLQAHAPREAAPSDLAVAVQRYRRPAPCVRLGLLAGRGRIARAAVDLSDGLADAVRQVAEASGLGAVVEAEKVPIDPGVRRWFAASGRDPVVGARGGGGGGARVGGGWQRMGGMVGGGRPVGSGLTRIGTLTSDRRLVLRHDDVERPWPEGFEHFRATPQASLP